MGDVVKMPPSKKAIKMTKVSNEIDEVILKHLEDMDVKTVAALLAHRLGALLARVDKKTELFILCMKVLKEQAGI